MRIKSGTKLNGPHANSAKNYQVSQNAQYAVSVETKTGQQKAGSKSLYVKDGAPPPRGAMQPPNPKRVQIEGTTYNQHVPNDPAFNDCGHHTEEVMHGSRLAYGRDVYSKSATVPGRDWGDGFDANMQLSKDVKRHYPNQVNEHADPAVGQGYVIQGQVRDRDLRQGWNTGTGNPHHAAPVVAKDGNNTVTAEASAPTGAGGRHNPGRTSEARYHMQTVGKTGDSFHEQWESLYRANRPGSSRQRVPITHVIEPK